MALGVCSGSTNPFNNGSATTTHFVGARIHRRNLVENGGDSALSYLIASYAMQCCKRVGTTITADSGTGTLFYAWYMPLGTNYRTVWAVDITKGSPNFTMQMFGRQQLPSLATFRRRRS